MNDKETTLNWSKEQLPSLVQQLAREREIVAEYRARIEEIEAEIEASPLGQALAHERAFLATALEGAALTDEDIRRTAVRAYEVDGDKRPHPGIGIRVMTRVEYDEAEALEHCRAHLPEALVLKRRTFEKVARLVPPSFVTLRQEPQATIATKLEDLP
jgi:hypothetical protein